MIVMKVIIWLIDRTKRLIKCFDAGNIRTFKIKDEWRAGKFLYNIIYYKCMAEAFLPSSVVEGRML